MTKGRTSDSRDSRESNSLDVEVSKAKGAASNGEAGARVDDAATAGSWDPYQVWLTRVKRPRDETVRMRKLSTRAPGPDADAAAAGTSSSSETPSQSSAKPSTA